MNSCRVCDNETVIKFLDLGATPLANSFLKREQCNETEPKFPLELVFCPRCGLVQLDHEIPPEILFANYIYVSSTSQTMPAHFAEYADEVTHRFSKSAADLVVEIGSNDGCLLGAFQRNNVRILGIEPAANIAAIANAAGLTTLNDFFCERSARSVRGTVGAAKMIVGNNVLAHVGDLKGFLTGVDVLLQADGVAVFEVPYLVDLLDRCEFDTIYHEHLSYFTVGSLQQLFSSKGLRLFDVQRVSVHGGSIRAYVGRPGTGPEVTPAVDQMLSLERNAKLDVLKTYQDFALRVKAIKRKNRRLLTELKASGASIAAYGAPAKGNTLLNYFEIGTEILDFVADRSPHKQGLYTPGTHIPVVDTERLLRDQPDYVLILAWNFVEEIVAQQREYLARGGRFIVPVPEPTVIAHSDHVEKVSNVR